MKPIISGRKDFMDNLNYTKVKLGTKISNSIFVLLVFLILVQLVCILPTKVAALVISDPLSYNLQGINTPWNILADSFIYDKKNNIYQLRGNVIISNKDMDIRVDTDIVNINNEDMIVETSEDTSILIGGNYIFCKALKLNLELKTGIVYNGAIFFKQNNLLITGSKIAKIEKGKYVIDEGFLTTCIGKNPAWSISGKNIKIKKGKHGVLQGAVLKVKQVPIIYLPYFVFPTLKRQSGLLSPEIRYSDQSLTYCQPIFLKINDISDATFYPTYKSNGNWLIGLEYRYMRNYKTKGLLIFDLGRNKVYGNNSYWLRSKFDKELPIGFTAKLGINLRNNVDEYFISNLGEISNFNRTKKTFRDFLNKDIVPYNNLGSNYFILNRAELHYVFNTALYWGWSHSFVQDDIRKNKVKPINKIASVQLDSVLRQVVELPLYSGVKIEYTNLVNEHNHSAYIANFQPQIYVPILFGRFASMDFCFTSQQIIENNENVNFQKENCKHSFRLNLSSEVSKVYKASAKDNNSFKHSIGVKVAYEYNPTLESMNYLCEPDYMNYKKLLTYSINNSLLVKYKDVSNQSERGTTCNYRELVNLNLKHSFKKGKENNLSSNIEGELFLSLNKKYALQTLALFDVSNKWISMCRSEICVQNDDNFCFSLGYIYKRNEIGLLKASLCTPLGEAITALITCGYNCLEDEKLVGSLGLYYNAQCWSAGIKYKKDIKDKSDSVSVSIELLGFGGNRRPSESEREKVNSILFTNNKRWETITIE